MVTSLQDAGGANRFSALCTLLDSEDTKLVHVSAPLQASTSTQLLTSAPTPIFASQEALAAEPTVMDKATVTDLARRVNGGDALGAQRTYQSNKRARQKAALAVEMKARVGAATLIAVLWRGAKVRQAVAATRKMKAQRAMEAVVAAARAEQEQTASREVAQAAQAQAEVQGEAHQQIWVRAVGDHDSRSVMVSLKAPTGDTELNGLGFGRLYSPQVGTLDPEKSFAAQGISKGATLSLLPRLIIGGAGGNPEDKNQETLSTAQSSTAVRVLDIDAAGIAQSCANMPAESDLEVYVEQKRAANAENAPHVATQTTLTLTLTL